MLGFLRHKKMILLFLAGIFCLPAAYWLFDQGRLRLNYPSSERYPIQGVDVSHHQGLIEWDELAKEENIRFAFIKATEGGDFKDPRFAENWRNSKKAGFVRGAYHFFTFCRSGKDQAQNFLSTVPYETGTLPVAIDLEFGGNCKKMPSRQEIIGEIKSFLREIKKTYPQKPIFYVTPEFHDYYMKDHVQEFPEHYLWLRNIYYEPAQRKCERWAIWQFANRGILKGVKVPIDLNVLCSSEEELIPLFEQCTANPP